MSEAYFERLTQMDNSFLIAESEHSAMHVASTQIHEAAPLRDADGSRQIERIQEYVASRLHLIAVISSSQPDEGAGVGNC